MLSDLKGVGEAFTISVASGNHCVRMVVLMRSVWSMLILRGD